MLFMFGTASTVFHVDYDKRIFIVWVQTLVIKLINEQWTAWFICRKYQETSLRVPKHLRFFVWQLNQELFVRWCHLIWTLILRFFFFATNAHFQLLKMSGIRPGGGKFFFSSCSKVLSILLFKMRKCMKCVWRVRERVEDRDEGVGKRWGVIWAFMLGTIN